MSIGNLRVNIQWKFNYDVELQIKTSWELFAKDSSCVIFTLS